MNLSEWFYPFRDPSGRFFNQLTFPSGEKHIKIAPNSGLNAHEPILITTRLQTSDDIINLLLATDAVRRYGFKEVHLFVPYLPYARQDRVMVPGEPLSIKVITTLLNGQNYASVSVFDVHSDIAGALLENVNLINNHKLVREVLYQWTFAIEGMKQKPYWLIAPDAGAAKKVYPLASEINYDRPVITATKVRDVANRGRIIATELPMVDLMGLDCFIVDDICDGGGTFVALATELKKKGAGLISLIVSHGIFSNGLELAGIDRIFTTDSFKTSAVASCGSNSPLSFFVIPLNTLLKD